MQSQPQFNDSFNDSALSLIAQAASVLQQGGIVAYPSGGVWGLAVLPAFASGLLERKGREEDKPFQVSCRNVAQAAALVHPCPKWLALSQLWPTGLTLVAPASAQAPQSALRQGQIGIRVPEHPSAYALLQSQSGPLVTTSLNRSGYPAAQTVQEAVEAVQRFGLADFLLPDFLLSDLVQTELPVPALAQQRASTHSTVLEVPTLRVLRQGAVSVPTLNAALAAAGLSERVNEWGAGGPSGPSEHGPNEHGPNEHGGHRGKG